MSQIQLLKVLVNERLAVAAEEIFGIVERIIVEYEEEFSRATREMTQNHQHTLRDTSPKPDIKLQRAGNCNVTRVTTYLFVPVFMA